MKKMKITGLLLCAVLFLPVRGAAAAQVFCTALAEAETGTLLAGENADTAVPAGSMAKLMTAYLIGCALQEGRLSTEQTVRVPAAAEHLPGATVWLLQGEEMSVSDLLKGMITGNANDAAVTLACAAAGDTETFVMDMNAAAFDLGMRATRFADAAGLSAENVTTARDLTLLCRALLQDETLLPYFQIWRDFLRDGKTELVNENRLVRTDDTLLGLKAGHGEECGYTLALAGEKNGMRCIAVVLGCGDADERFSAGRQLLSQGFSQYTVTFPDFSAEFLRPVTVRCGVEDAVLTECTGLRAAAAKAGKELSCTVWLPAYAEAPVKKGQRLGTAAFYSGDTLLSECPLTAAADVPKRTVRTAFLSLLRRLTAGSRN